MVPRRHGSSRLFDASKSAMTDAARADAPSPTPDVVVVLAALAAAAVLVVAVASAAPANVAFLFLVGAFLGVALYHATFGFTSAFRVLLADARSAGLRAQLVMLAIACALFFPALDAGSLFGQPVTGNVSPAGTSVAFGAFVFGIGMQLGGGCASGTLFAAGGGSTRMFVTLFFFIVGSVIGVAHLDFWQALPGLPPTSLVKSLGWPAALALNLAVFAAIWIFVSWLEHRRHGSVEPIARRSGPAGRIALAGPWPLLWGAIALALGNFLTLWLAGRPWGITSAFALWGGQLLQTAGVAVADWPSWQGEAQQRALAAPVLADITSVMDFGIMLGALLAAGLAGKFRPEWRVPLPHLLASVVGGLLLGYGARLAYGCNIGAFFSGVASGSLHGWLWIVAALAGNGAGLRLRPWFNLPVEGRQTAR